MITGLNIENLKVGNKTKLKKLVYMMLTTLKKENKLAWKMIVGNYFNNKQQRGKNEGLIMLEDKHIQLTMEKILSKI
jgi:hypothetical protein